MFFEVYRRYTKWNDNFDSFVFFLLDFNEFRETKYRRQQTNCGNKLTAERGVYNKLTTEMEEIINKNSAVEGSGK